MKKKISVLLTAIAAMSGMGGAAYGHHRAQEQNHYRLNEAGTQFLLISNFLPGLCDRSETTCSYLITSTDTTIPVDEVSNPTKDGEGIYLG